jgi:delta24-sterol reductase
MKNADSHKEKVTRIVEQLRDYKKTKSKKKIRFTHGSTNSTRVQDKSDNYIIDISSLNQILKIDKTKKIAIVEPNVPMDKLVDACLKSGLLPKVVMEFPGITAGGGVNGAALESSSFAYGQFNDTCIEYECLLSDGTLARANKYTSPDLFYGISGSYGSLALLTQITISLISSKNYVTVTFQKVSTSDAVDTLQKFAKKKIYDYLDAIVYDEKTIIIAGKLTHTKRSPVVTFSQPSDEWFYLYAKHVCSNANEDEITVPVKDFLFRYDRGAFWMGEYSFKLFHMPFTKFMRRALNAAMNTRTMYKTLHRTNIAQTFFIQDFYVPLSQTNNFLAFSKKHLDIYPLWLCPIKSTQTQQYLSPHFLDEKMLIDVGIWGNIPAGKTALQMNKLFENYVQKIGGRKMLYAEAFYTEQTFWNIYDQKNYNRLRKKFKAEDRFPTVWEKVRVRKSYTMNKWKGLIETAIELITKKFGI